MAKTSRALSALVAAGLLLGGPARPARGEIIASLELPEGFASGVSNVQGWAFTTTPGATLRSPFAVLIDGVEEFKVPCCGNRGDVQAVYPEAPLLTGFATVYNWGLAASMPVLAASDHAEAVPGTDQVLVQVVITDDMGGVEILSKMIDLYHPTEWPFSKRMEWQVAEASLSAERDSPRGFALPLGSECLLENSGFYGDGAAQLVCSNAVFTSPADVVDTCAEVVFTWERASQSFRLVSNCADPLE